MTNQDLKRARWWIQRWKAVGGGFSVAPGPHGIAINLVRKTQDDAAIEAIYTKTAASMEAELHDSPKKSETVFNLVAEMIAGARVPTEDQDAANDQGIYCCEEHGTIDDTDPPEAA